MNQAECDQAWHEFTLAQPYLKQKWDAFMAESNSYLTTRASYTTRVLREQLDRERPPHILRLFDGYKSYYDRIMPAMRKAYLAADKKKPWRTNALSTMQRLDENLRLAQTRLAEVKKAPQRH